MVFKNPILETNRFYTKTHSRKGVRKARCDMEAKKGKSLDWLVRRLQRRIWRLDLRRFLSRGEKRRGAGEDILDRCLDQLLEFVEKKSEWSISGLSFYFGWLSSRLLRLEPFEARQLIASVKDLSESVEFSRRLKQYQPELDCWRKRFGQITSLRDLTKRIRAIESGWTPETLPKAFDCLIDAPGFDMVSLRHLIEDGIILQFFGLDDDGRPLPDRLTNQEYDLPGPTPPFGLPGTVFWLSEKPLDQGLAPYRDQIKGRAKNFKALVREFDRIIGESGLEIASWDLWESVPPSIESEITRALVEQGIDLGKVIRLRLEHRSEIKAWAVGNWADSCLNFSIDRDSLGSTWERYVLSGSNFWFFSAALVRNDHAAGLLDGRVIACSGVFQARQKLAGLNYDQSPLAVLINGLEVAKNYQHLAGLVVEGYRRFWGRSSWPVKLGTGFCNAAPPEARLEPSSVVVDSSGVLFYHDALSDYIYDFPKPSSPRQPLGRAVIFSHITPSHLDQIIAEERLHGKSFSLTRRQLYFYLADQRKRFEQHCELTSFTVWLGGQLTGYVLMMPEKRPDKQPLPGRVFTSLVVRRLAILPDFLGTEVAEAIVDRLKHHAAVTRLELEFLNWEEE